MKNNNLEVIEKRDVKEFKTEAKELREAFIPMKENFTVGRVDDNTIINIESMTIYNSINNYYNTTTSDPSLFNGSNNKIRMSAMSATFEQRANFIISNFEYNLQNTIITEILSKLSNVHVLVYNIKDVAFKVFPMINKLETYIQMIGQLPLAQFRIECMDIAIALTAGYFNKISNLEHIIFPYIDEDRIKIFNDDKLIQEIYDSVYTILHSNTPILANMLYEVLFLEAATIYFDNILPQSK